MHDIIEHYGKVIVALFAIAVALLVAAAVATTITRKTNESVNNLEFNENAKDAVGEGLGETETTP